MPVMSGIVARLSRLKELSLPDDIRQKEPNIVQSILDAFNGRLGPIQLRFISRKPSQACPYLNIEDSDEGESGSDDETVDDVDMDLMILSIDSNQ